jgi:hypothetical protein
MSLALYSTLDMVVSVKEFSTEHVELIARELQAYELLQTLPHYTEMTHILSLFHAKVS